MKGEAAHRHPRRIPLLPTTDPGWWFLRLAVVSAVLVAAAAVVPRGASIGFACAVAAGAFALVATLRDGDRALSVFLALLPLAVVLAFALAEVVGGV